MIGRIRFRHMLQAAIIVYGAAYLIDHFCGGCLR